MNFDFTDEQKLFAESVRRFAQAHLAKDAVPRAHNPRFPFDVAKLMSEQGLLGITIPEADGGQGGTLMDAIIAIEQTAAVCPRSADVVQFGNFGPIRTFSEYGSDYQKKKWLSECLAGRMVISLGMSEPDAGSAVTDLKTTAKPDGTGYIVNGTKVFSTFSPEASVFLVYLRYGPGVGGIGSVRGAFVAALLVGLVDTAGRAFLPPVLRASLPPAWARWRRQLRQRLERHRRPSR